MDETATTMLMILGTSFGVIFASLITVMVTSIRIQQRESIATRQLITDASKANRDLIDKNRDLIDRARKENRDLIDQARKENRDLINRNRDLIDKNRDLIDKNRDLIERNHGTLTRILGATRERLARIEGRLQIGRPAGDDPEADGDSREAA